MINIPHKQVFHFKREGGSITRDGISEMNGIFRHSQFPISFSRLAAEDPSWLTYSVGGMSYTKRLDKYLRQNMNHKAGSIVLSVIGETFRRHSQEVDFYFMFRQNPRWRAGSFGESHGSCWWKQYREERKMFLENGGMAICLFDNKPLPRQNWGIGRCWMYPLSPEHMVIFNAYGPYPLFTLAQAASEVLGLKYTKKRLGSRIFINGDTGYIMSPRTPRKKYFWVPCSDHPDTEYTRCQDCGTTLPLGRFQYTMLDQEDADICGDCRDYYYQCCWCGGIGRLEHFGERGGVCKFCIARHKLWWCDSCDRWTQGIKKVYNGEIMCQSCFSERKLRYVTSAGTDTWENTSITWEDTSITTNYVWHEEDATWQRVNPTPNLNEGG